MEFLISIVIGAALGLLFRNWMLKRMRAKMEEDMATIIKLNPSLLEGLPLVFIERVTDSSGVEQLLVYEEISKKFVTQARNLQELGDRLNARWPNEPIFIKQGESYVRLGTNGELDIVDLHK